jgi:membrane-bound serine protease (ClpP class)
MDWPILIAILMFVGMIFLLLEIFVVPGFGPVGVLAIVFLGMGAYFAWIKLSMAWGIGVTMASILSVFISIIILRKTGAANRFILGQHIDGKKPNDMPHESKRQKANQADVPVGTTGIAISDLRPSGIGEFQDQRLNIIADGIYIKRNTPVKIVRIEGNRIFVEEENENEK